MKLVIATGGTGGHVYPALAVAHEAQAQGWEVLFLLGEIKEGVRFGGFKSVRLPAGPIKGVSPWRKALSAVKITFGALKSSTQLKGSALLAFGSYASVPALLAARALRVPYWLMEQNVIPGATIRLFASKAKGVFTTFPDTRLPRGTRALWVGNPLRPELRPLGRDEALRFWGFDSRPVVLVLGGSLGARTLSVAAYRLTRKMPEVQFLIITGKRDYGLFDKKRGENFLVVDFVEDMSYAYSAASLAVSRAGGGAIAELAFFGVPAVLVPYPFAADRHQHANARSYASLGGAVVLEESEGFEEELEGLLWELLGDPGRLRQMARGARSFAKPDAARRVLEKIKEVLG